LTTQEAVLSSRIEGTQATLGDVLKFEAGEEPNQPERSLDIGEIINYRSALRVAETDLKNKPFNLNMLKELHAILLNSVRGHDKRRGEFRNTQNFIGRPGSLIKDAYFVPPSPLGLFDHLSDWEKYYHAERPDALVQLAVIHAQFEILHPFDDGNGRLGRIIIPLFLYEKRLLNRPMFYMSAWFDRNRDEYITRLRSIGKEPDAWNNWVLFFLKGVAEQATLNCEKAQAIMALYKDLSERSLKATRSQYGIPMLDQMFQRPIFQSKHFSFPHLPPTAATVSNLLREMKDADIIKVLTPGGGRRGTTYVLAELINLCEGKKVF